MQLALMVAHIALHICPVMGFFLDWGLPTLPIVPAFLEAWVWGKLVLGWHMGW
jgi:hypothetical protein